MESLFPWVLREVDSPESQRTYLQRADKKQSCLELELAVKEDKKKKALCIVQISRTNRRPHGAGNSSPSAKVG